jgi:hypothetical protein
VLLEKGLLCMVGARREGRRKVGGVCCILLVLSRCLIPGRIAVEVDIVNDGSQWRCVELRSVFTRSSKYFEHACA